MERSSAHASLVAIEFEGVGFSHREVEVLRDASFHVHRGEFVALVGPNGSGKTTILRLVMGLARPGRGRIAVLGRSPDQARSGIGYVPQGMGFDPTFPISVEEVVRMGRLEGFARGRTEKCCDDVDQALELAAVADLRDRPYSALSGGQRRRVLIARALASAPELLILDEPTANMDAESEARLFAVLGSLKAGVGSAVTSGASGAASATTILIATHDTAFVTSLTDVVLCVGERGDRTVVRHASGPVPDAPAQLYGGHALRVLHDIELGDDVCCLPEGGEVEAR